MGNELTKPLSIRLSPTREEATQIINNKIQQNIIDRDNALSLVQQALNSQFGNNYPTSIHEYGLAATKAAMNIEDPKLRDIALHEINNEVRNATTGTITKSTRRSNSTENIYNADGSFNFWGNASNNGSKLTNWALSFDNPLLTATVGTSMILNPIPAALGIAGGTTVDYTTSKLTNANDWGDLLYLKTGLNPNIASWTNPGYFVGGHVGKLAEKPIGAAITNLKLPIKSIFTSRTNPSFLVSKDVTPLQMHSGFKSPQDLSDVFKLWRLRYPNVTLYKPSENGSYPESSAGYNWLTVGKMGLTDSNKALIDYFSNNRLKNFGIDPNDVYAYTYNPLSGMSNMSKFNRHVQYLKNRLDFKLVIPTDNTLSDIGGLHIRSMGAKDEIVIPTNPWRKKPFDYTLFHEGYMHPTEDAIFNLKVPGSNNKTIKNLYEQVAYPSDIIDPKIINSIYKNGSSSSAKEIRALNGEMIKKLAVFIKHSTGKSLEEVLLDQSLIESVIDEQFKDNPEKLVQFMRGMDSGYANDWSNLITSKEITPEQSMQLTNRFVNMLKKYPILIYGVAKAGSLYNTLNLDSDIESFKKGGKPKIRIKKKNRGKFTESAKAAGESVQEHARHVLNDPNATPLQKKRANFARNAAKWHH